MQRQGPFCSLRPRPHRVGPTFAAAQTQNVDDLKPEFVFGVSISFGVWSLVEVARLAFGYFGNLGESVRTRGLTPSSLYFARPARAPSTHTQHHPPAAVQVAELSACLLLTLFPQVPIVAFICFGNPSSVPSDLACGVIMAVFFVRGAGPLDTTPAHTACCPGPPQAVEVPTCFRTLRGIVDRRKAEFYEQCANEESGGGGGGSASGAAAHAEEGVTLLSRPQLPSPVRNRTPRDTLPTVSRSRHRPPALDDDAAGADGAGEGQGVELASTRRLRSRLARRRAEAESPGSGSDASGARDMADEEDGDDGPDAGPTSPLLRRGRTGARSSGAPDSGSGEDASPARTRSSLGERLRHRRRQRLRG